jgi:hypothetical protein
VVYPEEYARDYFSENAVYRGKTDSLYRNENTIYRSKKRY